VGPAEGVEEEPLRTGLRAGWIRRRWWVPLLTVLVATTIGGVVAANRSFSYTSTMVFVVPSTPDTEISPDGAQRLASTYSALLLNDDLIARAVGRAVNREPADVKRTLTAVNPVNTALVRVTYTGRTRAEALAGVTALQASMTGPKPASPAIRPNSVLPVQEAQVRAPPSLMMSLVLAALFGLCAGAVLVIALERSDVRVDGTAVLEDYLPDVPILGTVAPVGRHGDVPVRDQPFSPAAEGFQRVRMALERLGLGSRINGIVVMSADKQEGKTTFVANLGVALARQQRMVLLVSGDMRRPGLERMLDVAPSVGLADLLDEKAEDPLRALFSIAPDLWLLPAGLPSENPVELLEADRIRELLKRIGLGSMLVIIDTPPALRSADAAALADAADGAVLVVRSGRSRLRAVRETVVGVRRDNLPVLGMVLLDHRDGRYRRAYRYAGGGPQAIDHPRILPLDTRTRRASPKDEGPKAAG
jgi:capsular exopolysaccharide synthesis family protein